MTGSGTLHYSNGGTLKGRFVNGKMNGLGRGVYKNGDVYVGMWRNAMFHGPGVFHVRASNQWQMGRFELGSMVEGGGKGSGRPSSLGTIEGDE